ncbi:MAG: hypothetical protein E7277_05995 [Lachnospiraceae bacterium]|nr:hypothetical protein [Lachnospiraceae bacterium]
MKNKRIDKRVLLGVVLVLCIAGGAFAKVMLTNKVEMNSMVKNMKFYRNGKEVVGERNTMCNLSHVVVKMAKEGFSMDDIVDSLMILDKKEKELTAKVPGYNIVVDFKKPMDMEAGGRLPKIKCVVLRIDEGEENIYCFQEKYAKRPQDSVVAYRIHEDSEKEICKLCE